MSEQDEQLKKQLDTANRIIEVLAQLHAPPIDNARDLLIACKKQFESYAICVKGNSTYKLAEDIGIFLEKTKDTTL